MHGGVALEDIKEPNIAGMENGYWNLDKHVRNLQSFGQTVVIAFNKFATDTDEEIEVLRKHCEEMGCGLPSTVPLLKVERELWNWRNW